MTDIAARPAVSHRTYVKPTGEAEERITVNIGPDGRVRMTAESLHQLLTALGYVEAPKGHRF